MHMPRRIGMHFSLENQMLRTMYIVLCVLCSAAHVNPEAGQLQRQL